MTPEEAKVFLIEHANRHRNRDMTFRPIVDQADFNERVARAFRSISLMTNQDASNAVKSYERDAFDMRFAEISAYAERPDPSLLGLENKS